MTLIVLTLGDPVGDDPGREPGGGEDLQAVVGPAQGGLHRL